MCGETHGPSSRRETSSSLPQHFKSFRGSTTGRSRPRETSTCPGQSMPSSTGSWPPESWCSGSPRSESAEDTGRLKSTRRHRRTRCRSWVRPGARRIEWAREHMPVLAAIREELKTKKTLQGLRIGMALHVEAKTGVLALSLREAGAVDRLASCVLQSTVRSVSTALSQKHGLALNAKKWQTNDEYYTDLNKVL